MTDQIIDSIPLEDEFQFSGPDGAGQCVAMFYAFNTVITLQAYAEADVCRAAFSQAKDACRAFERHLSRTLPHSDIARLNDAQGAWVAIAPDTYELLAASKRYCAESGGIFDITMGSAVRLWNFHEGIMPNGDELAQALTHVDWRAVELREESSDEGDTSNGKRFFARLTDPQASVDVGGTAKGYIADALGDILQAAGVESFIVNLGGNVLAHGTKPNGNPWMIGLQAPR